jgi:iron complex transport system substrate-binding protein
MTLRPAAVALTGELLMPKLVALLLVLAIALSACGGDEDAASTSTTTGGSAAAEGEAGDEAPAPIDLGRVVVLGEDFLLADVLALGVEPVAATATLGDEFTGIERDTSGIEPLDQFELDAEALAALRPDLLIAAQYVVDEAGLDLLEAVAETIVIPSDPDWRVQFLSLAESIDATETADDLLADYDAAVAAADEEVDDSITVSMPTVYSGDTVAVWTDGPVNIPATFLDVGVTLSPGAGELDGEDYGRVYISLELLDEIDGDVIVMLQSSAVEDEDAALASVQANDLWQTLPAVEAGRVEIIDRLGYPGVEGQTRLATEIPALLAG